MLLKFPFICFLITLLSFRAIICFINPDCRLIPMTSFPRPITPN
jgi:hypothetical protein